MKNYILSGEWRWPLTGSNHVQKWVVLLYSRFTLFLGCTLQIISTHTSHHYQLSFIMWSSAFMKSSYQLQ